MTGRRQEDAEDFDGRPLRRAPNGPWWQRWGLLGVLVLGIVGVSSGLIPSAVSQTKDKTEQIQRELDRHQREQGELNTRIDRRLEEQLNVLRALCVNAAPNEPARRECWSGSGVPPWR